MKKYLSFITILGCAVLLLPQPAHANNRIKIDTGVNAAARTNGMTFTTPKGAFSIGIQGGIVQSSGATNLTVRTKKPRKKINIGKKRRNRLASRVFQYQLTGDDVSITNPVWVSIRLREEPEEGKEYVVRYLNRKEWKWETADSSYNAETGMVQASIPRKKAIVAVFRKEADPVDTYTGIASFMDWHAGAMNEVPLGSTVTVRNPENGATVDVQILSRGPYVPGRIIDLPREVFAELAPLSRGIINVEVLYDSSQHE